MVPREQDEDMEGVSALSYDPTTDKERATVEFRDNLLRQLKMITIGLQALMSPQEFEIFRELCRKQGIFLGLD